MRLDSVKIKNFRGYKDEVVIKIDDLTAFVGKNDIGKSTVLEALDIFFNDGKGNYVVKLDKDDINKSALNDGDNDIYITAIFSNLPTSITIDATRPTTFENEYLLNSDGKLEIVKRYPNAGAAKVYIRANHPCNPKCSELLLKKLNDYKKIINDEDIECENLTVNAIMRSAIWGRFVDDLQLTEILIDTSKEDAKNIWEKVQTYLPQYSLFQSDRKNSDNDSEVQDPLKKAVAQILGDQQVIEMFADIAQRVEVHLKEVADTTLGKLREMNPDIANSLNPIIPSASALKWIDVFKNVSICGDENIPINKRGSGIKRLILLNFFRAEAERRLRSGNSQSIIYAIEEPETSQHTDHQKLLINAFIDLAAIVNTQVLLTTHSSIVVKGLCFENLRLINKQDDGNKLISEVLSSQLPYPSLNEINFVAFKDFTEEYHNELYGYLESEGWLPEYKIDKEEIDYVRIRGGNQLLERKILTEYIRHQIHHPENTLNIRYTHLDLEESINLMREFILTKRSEL
ncbi:ATP-binding protein [Sphingobacterium hotanense]|uniref:ATP-binding protein n=1 Tax=Sphingobacterium hotanense TaxID=649196 RepID=A0ABT7NSK4_9SPHI|nr:ATP-binding protein [Sphingobacterium hotanense]MDM1050208.1 ATP-binding protein [Sphingobacterium hotanense]